MKDTLQATLRRAGETAAASLAGPAGTLTAGVVLALRDFVLFPMRWRVRTRLPERFGLPCRVVVRGKMNSCLVEFEDGFRVVTSRNYVRKAVPDGDRSSV